MQLAIQTPPENTSFAELRDTWQTADELGFRAAFTFDHFVPLEPGATPSPTAAIPSGTQLDRSTTLAALGACTSRMLVGTLVTGVSYRHPVVLAKMAVTLDEITCGRAGPGLGATWHGAEHRMYGIDYPPVGERMGRLDEALTIFRRLRSEDTVDFAGRWYQLRGAVFDPKPVNADLDGRLVATGRSPGHLERTAYAFAELSGSRDREDALVGIFQGNRGGAEEAVRRRVLVGQPDTTIATLRSYADAGVDMAIINLRPPYGEQDLELLARDVMPALQ